MRKNSTRRLPSALPIKLRTEIDPFDKNGWTCRGPMKTADASPPPNASSEETDGTRFTRPWKDHVPHAGRRPPQKGVANFRGSTTDGNGRELMIESTLEKAASMIMLADRTIMRVQSQVGPVYHVDAKGKKKRPVFDFVATTEAHRSLAIAVKPERHRERSGIEGLVARVRQQRPDFADDVAIWTEQQLSRCAEHNAGLILRSRRLRNEADVAAMRRTIGSGPGAFPLSQLIGSFGHGARGLAAAVNLIDEGFLVPAERGRIRPELKVRLAA